MVGLPSFQPRGSHRDLRSLLGLLTARNILQRIEAVKGISSARRCAVVNQSCTRLVPDMRRVLSIRAGAFFDPAAAKGVTWRHQRRLFLVRGSANVLPYSKFKMILEP
jgi:hypothetical protein